MKIHSATPYLIVYGRAQRAFALYEQAFGAKTDTVMRFGDMDKTCPEARKDKIMHSSLKIGDALLMLSDGPGGGEAPKSGVVNVALDFETVEEMRRSFAVLAETGTVVEDIFAAPWGDFFGAVVDELGVSWMMTSPQQPREQRKAS